jgi:D-beta-D-heptose 7-phosphate kinase/D-beta-D-heptose 1-phosphate adenosyltransferase
VTDPALTASRSVTALLEHPPAPDVLVIGDLMLDRYVSGPVDRLSPEAPVQILRHERQWDVAGGAAAVACNLARLGARVRLIGLVGDDPEGGTLRAALDPSVHASGVLADSGRPTTLKTRFVVSRQHHHHQMLRVDREDTAPAAPALADRLLAQAEEALPRVRVVVLSDYAKGVLAPELCQGVIRAARRHDVPVLVDPKGRHLDKYRGASVLTPNRSEAGRVTGRAIAQFSDAERAAIDLIERFDIETAVITLDRDGIYVKTRGRDGVALSTQPREVADVTGAGDNVIAVLACAMAAGCDPVAAATLANAAGGIAVEHFGPVTVAWDQIAARVALATGEGQRGQDGRGQQVGAADRMGQIAAAARRQSLADAQERWSA